MVRRGGRAEEEREGETGEERPMYHAPVVHLAMLRHSKAVPRPARNRDNALGLKGRDALGGGECLHLLPVPVLPLAPSAPRVNVARICRSG